LLCESPPRFIGNSTIDVGKPKFCQRDQNGFCLFSTSGQSVGNMSWIWLLILFYQSIGGEIFNSLRQQCWRDTREALSEFHVATCLVNKEITKN